MKHEWSTKVKDMQVARLIIDEYASERSTDTLGLFELVVGSNKEKMDLRLAGWVTAISEYFMSTYGGDYGDYVTKKVISKCITNGTTIH